MGEPMVRAHTLTEDIRSNILKAGLRQITIY